MITDLFYNGTPLAAAFQFGFFAIVLFQISFIIFQTYFIRRPEYYYYLLYMVCIIPYFLSHTEEALNFPIFFTHHPELKFYFDKPFIIVNFFTYLNFSRNFLDIPVKYPAFNKTLSSIITFFVLLGCAGVLVFIIFGESFYAELLFTFFYIGLFPATVWMVYKFFKLQDTRLNNFILLGGIFIIVSSMSAMVLFTMKNLGTISDNVIPTIPAQLGIVAELLVFTTGLSYKTSLMEKEKMKTQRELMQQMERNMVLSERMNDMRHKIARDLHDEVGSTLSGINLYSEVALSTLEKQPEKTGEVLGKIKQSTSRMMESLYDILWALNPKTETLGQVAERMSQFLRDMLEPHGISWSFHCNEKLNGLKLHLEAQKNIYLVFKETINNATKYSGCTKVEVTISLEADIIHIAISDDGKGFELNNSKRGNGIFSMQERIRELNGTFTITTQPGNGCHSLLALSIPNIRG